MGLDLTSYDLRIWDQYYSTWEPLSPLVSVSIAKTGGLAIDAATVTTPGDHRLSHIFQAAKARPVPVTWELNGVVWSGQATNPVRKSGDDGVMVWELHIESDDKHAHRLLSRDPGNTTAPELLRSTIGEHLVSMLSDASSRTGVPLYVKADAPGPVVNVEPRVEDTIASLLERHVESSEIFVDTRILLPGHPLPGSPTVDAFKLVGDTEAEWMQQALTAGMWPQSAINPRIRDTPVIVYHADPPNAWSGRWTGIFFRPKDIMGAPRISTNADYYWTPFQSSEEASSNGQWYVLDSSRIGSFARSADKNDLTARSGIGERWRIGAFVTEWAAGRWEAGVNRSPHRDTLAAEGLLRRVDGTPVVTVADQDALDSWIGAGAAYAWREPNGVWVVANQQAFDAEIARLKTVRDTAAAQQTPAPLVHIHAGRERRHVVFSTAPGGGVESWEASIHGRDAAAVISGMQMDQWQAEMVLESTTKRQSTDGLEDSEGWYGGPVDVSGMSEVTTDVSPSFTVEDSLVAFGAMAGRVDIAQVGPYFYREKFASISGQNGTDLLVQVQRAWAEAQGGTALTLGLRGGAAVFGDDLTVDGITIPGWKIGDRITFISDTGEQISEIITGWNFTHNVGEAPTLTPTLGRDIHLWSPIDRLLDKVVDTEKAVDKQVLSPSRRLSSSELNEIVAESTRPLSEAILALQASSGSGAITGSITLIMSMEPGPWRTVSPYFDFRITTTDRTVVVRASGSWTGQMVAEYDNGYPSEAVWNVTADTRSFYSAPGVNSMTVHYSVLNS